MHYREPTFAWEKAVLWMYICFFPFLSYVCLSLMSWLSASSLPMLCFFIDYLTCGTMYIFFVGDTSGEELYLSSHISVCGPSAPVLSWQYIIILLMFHCVFRLQKYEVITKLLLPKSTYQVIWFHVASHSGNITMHNFLFLYLLRTSFVWLSILWVYDHVCQIH